jgi:hypothetical protein
MKQARLRLLKLSTTLETKGFHCGYSLQSHLSLTPLIKQPPSLSLDEQGQQAPAVLSAVCVLIPLLPVAVDVGGGGEQERSIRHTSAGNVSSFL